MTINVGFVTIRQNNQEMRKDTNMSNDTLKIEIIPNGFLYFEPVGSVRDGMQFIATAKRNSSQDAKVADWFEGTKKQNQSRDFKSVMHTALAACDAVNGGKDKWRVFRAIENYQKSHNLTITVQPKGQNKGNSQNKSQSLADILLNLKREMM